MVLVTNIYGEAAQLDETVRAQPVRPVGSLHVAAGLGALTRLAQPAGRPYALSGVEAPGGSLSQNC